MFFRDFFAAFEAMRPFDADAYERDVSRGRALAAELERRLQGELCGPVDDNLRRALVQAELAAAISEPLNALKHLAHYLALNGDYWAAGKLEATYTTERQRQERARQARRGAARRINTGRQVAKRQWLALASQAGRRIRKTRSGARLSNAALAQRIVTSQEFNVLGARRPSWKTVYAELARLKLNQEKMAGRADR